MAADIGNLNIFITGDSSQLEKAIKKSQKLLSDMASSFEAAGKSVKDFNANSIAAMMGSTDTKIKKQATELWKALSAIEKVVLSETDAVKKGSMEAKNIALAYIEEKTALDNLIKSKKDQELQAAKEISTSKESASATDEATEALNICIFSTF